ncbi:OLC1v1015057C1 [Oldenlandia corymbosa var. corymbosa]|uniref:OLC1v1015057C1 n=1 Tax=Oldenlandia corymbosa var. corymbosa TaxID=529605 RepID=A0AAV1E337_OLDCO|nr:OLC1v1015057C1 [Oldenlandia corymbosa var. corymbosa]
MAKLVRNASMFVIFVITVTATFWLKFTLIPEARDYCLPYQGDDKVEVATTVVLVAIVVSSLAVGFIILLQQNYLRTYIVYLVFQLLLVVGSMVVLILLVNSVSPGDEKLDKDFPIDQEWPQVEQCLAGKRFCDHHEDEPTCCEKPKGCPTADLQGGQESGTDADRECKKWKDNSTNFCYLCSTCHASILTYQREYSNGMKITAGTVIVLLVAVTVAQIVEVVMRISVY